MKTESVVEKQKRIPTTTLESIHGCILGTAIGDAVGLKREGLSRDRAIWLHGDQPAPDLIFGKGFCSDDTEHTVLVGCALLRSAGSVELFERVFVGYLQKWLLTAPAGIGMGTLKAVIKSFFVSPKNYGVFTAGNGPAMRSALLGLVAADDKHLVHLNRVCTRITHTDPKAEEGSLLVARAAKFAASGAATNQNVDPMQFLEHVCPTIEGDELKQHMNAVMDGLRQNLTPREFAEYRGWGKGPTGYINQSVPAAIYCWAFTPNDLRSVVTNAVLLGGDTDSVAAIAGAIAGAGCGFAGIPKDWLDRLAEWPRDKSWMKQLATEIHQSTYTSAPRLAPSPCWGRTLIRNLLFGVTVVLLYFRRFIPIPARSRS